ncbi:MAG: hypothetical protein HKN33_08435 [Pyrinomonadaceae bacterium]|nr:hypothetical protein [Pyrinomonadaceae bacterium]
MSSLDSNITKISKSEKSKFLPIWVWIIVVVQICLVSFFSIGTAMNPGGFLPNVSELDYPTQLYITRNITAVVGLIVALLLRSHKALFAVLFVRMVTDITDAISVFTFDVDAVKSAVPMVVILLIIPALLAIIYLWKRFGQERKP